MNQICLVGKVLQLPTEECNNIVIKVTSNIKKDNGEYRSDSISCKLSTSLINATKQYCKIGDVVGIKGRIEVNNNENQVVCDRLTYLSRGGV